MHQPPRPTGSRRSAPSALARLLAGAVIAGFGAVLLLVGLASVVAPGRGAPADAGSAAATHVPAGGTGDRATTGPAASPPPLPAGYPVLVGAGDIGDCDVESDEATAALVARIPGIVFTLGDNAYDDGSPDAFRDCFGSSWGRFRDRIALPVAGNHDHGTGGASGYRAYFGDAAARDGRTWYSQDVGAWHVVVLDSTCDKADGGCAPDSEQVRWLRDDLARSDARCTLALFHHPRFSSGDHGPTDAVAPFWDALYDADADLVLNGHDHSYERFRPQDPAGRRDRQRGLTQVVVGTGGTPLRGFKDPAANSLVRASLAHGVLALALEPSGWSFRFISVDGSFSDFGRGACH